MSDYNYFEYPPAMWLREYPDLREARGLSETRTIDRCLELRRRWMAAGLSGQTICNFRLDNPYATDDALLCLVNRARHEIHNKATGHKDNPRKACSMLARKGPKRPYTTRGTVPKPRALPKPQALPKPPQRWQDAPEIAVVHPAPETQPAARPAPQKERLAA